MKLDRINLRLLAELQREGRITNQALAERVGLSASACLDRVRRLQQEGVVEGFGARIALDRVAASVTVIATVTLLGLVRSTGYYSRSQGQVDTNPF